MRASIEPGVTATEHLDEQIASFEIDSIDVGDFKLSAIRWLDRSSDLTFSSSFLSSSDASC